MGTLRRLGLLAPAVLMAAAGLIGCGQPVCPAIGWLNALTVQLDGDTSAVDHVQLCTEAGCAPADDVDPAGPLGPISVTDHAGDTWTFSVDTLPETFTVRALAADGQALADFEVTPDWVRVGGSARCGGPREATVTVQL